MYKPFNSIYSHGFIRATVAIPFVRVSDPEFNVQRILHLAEQASGVQAAITLFPELGISSYSNDDLFHQDALLDATLSALASVVQASRDLSPVLLIGAPLRFEEKLFNCAVVIYHGEVLGIVPKTYIPNYREFYEKRQFCSALDAFRKDVPFLGQMVPFGNDLVFEASNVSGFALHVEICEDIWSPIPPSTYGALAGATILANLSASNITVGKTEYRRQLCASQSAKCISAYMYSAAGPGESTTDLAWDGYAVIYENDDLLAESLRFHSEEQLISADIDLDRLIQDRMRMTSFNDTVAGYRLKCNSMRRVTFSFQIPEGETGLIRNVPRFPYVPADDATLEERCFEVYNIQVHSLIKRLAAANINKVVIGVSGGLDSTQALIVAARTMDLMGLPRSHILAYTMPGFATSVITKDNAHNLMKALEVTDNEIDIKPSCMQMFKDIGHPFANSDPVYDTTFENIQAGDRTSHLFRLANLHDALVIGTGDLSELALGWTTYGVGDQMAHYNINSSVPKTLIQYLIRWAITAHMFDAHTNSILQSILDTEISPELVPDVNGTSEKPAQKTEKIIGPYELQDFNLYYISRFGFRPSKVAYLAHNAWGDRTRGLWPKLLPDADQNEYNLQTIKYWLEVFLYRFFQISQYKRSAMPNAAKVGSGGSLSPRSDWRAPSDSEAAAWLDELHRNVPDHLA